VVFLRKFKVFFINFLAWDLKDICIIVAWDLKDICIIVAWDLKDICIIVAWDLKGTASSLFCGSTIYKAYS
jgi:hypothetical protein